MSSFLSQNNQLDNNQSGFKSGPSTETALLSVTEALRSARAESKSSVLILLDLSAAFDTVNHQILLSTLSSMGITGTALHWFESYLTGRSFRCLGEEKYPNHINWLLGFLRVQSLGPSSYSLHHWDPSFRHMVFATIATLVGKTSADNTQLYLSFQPDDPTVPLGSQLPDETSWHGWKNITCISTWQTQSFSSSQPAISTAPVYHPTGLINNNTYYVRPEILGWSLMISWP